MSDIFHTQIRKSIADPNLQSALDANAIKRIKVRQTAFESLSNPEQLRNQGHAVRADVIEHLDDYLTRFTSQLHDNGIQVHYAADAEQANQIVLEIANQHQAKLIAKSKTMVSEEIGLNHQLEAHGFRVVETDLGEYIVQLRGEPPSHIITPAVHLKRQDVGKLFEEKLGLPYTEDIGVMTNAARRTLRQVFLDADIGISGVNFGVAETGTLCLVTNEGNGRMVTTMPKVHIALMGMERIVPTLDDLALMLTLLPRSATGQKLTVYTSLINSPRRADDPDGPLERHVILVDNGRKAVRESELREILYCIRCGACLNACPVFREIGGYAYVNKDGEGSPYSGPMGSVVSPALFGQSEFGHLARASTLCGACKEACPVDINLPKLLLRIRAGIGVNQPGINNKSNAPYVLSTGLKFFTLAASSARRFRIALGLAGIFGSVATLFSKRDPWIRLPAFSGWGYSKDFPRPAAKTFRSRHFNKSDRVLHQNGEIPSMLDAPIPVESSIKEITLSKDGLIRKFSEELEALGGKFYTCSDEDVLQQILAILQTNAVEKILAWDAILFSGNLIERINEAGIEVIQPTLINIQASSLIKVGLSGASAAIADTGSILLLGGPGKPMTASLIPEIHIALLRKEDVFPSLSQVLQIEEIRTAPAAVVITGPSRTADIEMTLTIGVHGPGEIHVICVK